MKTTICLLFLMAAIHSLGCNRPVLVGPFEPERIGLTYEADGRKFYVADDGNAYRETESSETSMATHRGAPRSHPNQSCLL